MTTTFSEMQKTDTSTGSRVFGIFEVKWVHVAKPAKRAKKESLAAINKRLFADPKGLLAWAEANSQKLTGQARI
jgi:hypothetical protein